MSRYTLFASALLALALAGTYARSAVGAQDEAVKRFTVALQGKWQMTSRIEDGVLSEAELIQNRTVGIIKLEGDTLTFCVGTDGTRPSDFKSERGDGRLLVEFKKVKT